MHFAPHIFCMETALYNFKRNTQVYLADLSNPAEIGYHKLLLYPDFSVSQSMSERSVPQKTLHRRGDVHEGAVITKANPANFSFTVPLLDYTDGYFPILIKLSSELVDYKPDHFDLYIMTDTNLLKLEKCVIDNLVFNIGMKEISTISVSGTAAKLIEECVVMPAGTEYIPTGDYNAPKKVSISLGGTLVESVASLNIEVSSGISWISWTELNKTLNNEISYPSEYTMSDRVVSGSITQFITSDNQTTHSNYTVTDPMNIKIFTGISQVTPLLEFDFPSVVYTRRANLGGELFTRVYDYRLNTNSVFVKPKYKGV